MVALAKSSSLIHSLLCPTPVQDDASGYYKGHIQKKALPKDEQDIYSDHSTSNTLWAMGLIL